ncbi:hypothetical protein D1872_340650 [compost metagenome]
MAPLAMDGRAMGRAIDRKALKRDAPRVLATCSSLSSTARNPSRAAFTVKEADTKSIAAIIPA